ncbi:S41 family peptidase [Polyangium sp. 15x6]|uniref:S41 family peptidase n=1 Tax=Polyangium sp. 15x6 TaxID=3042687 RepID=UPI002499D7CA|nr:S41 family peptidase [Polyangium sp. 15x6]MDI3286788.1 S41 family peptidase [Polyangium sp. 15x6]
MHRRLLAGFCVLMTGCAASGPGGSSPPLAPPAAAAPSPVIQGETTAKGVRGSWRSRGYGWLLTVSDKGLLLHHESAAGCYADPTGTAGLLEIFGYSQPGPEGAVHFLSLPGETRYHFDRIDRLPPSCNDEKRAWDAPRVFEVFAATLAEHYAFFKERNLDWSARVEAGRAQVSPGMPERKLFDVLSTTLQGLGDAHVNLSAEIGAEVLSFEETHSQTLELLSARARAEGRPAKEVERAWLRAYRDGILQVILGGKGHQAAKDRILWGFAAPRVGYLNVVTMGGYGDHLSREKELSALDLVLDEAMSAFHGADAVIVDVTNNRGGYDLISRAIANRFADQKRLAFTKQAYRAKGMAPQAFHVEPSPRPRFTGRVYLLTSDVTVSAGETFTLAMRALPHVKHLGTTTRGAFSDVLEKPLPNGWKVEFSNEIYLDTEGQLFEARGVPPEETIDVFPKDDLSNGHTKAVLRLVQLSARPEAAVK